MVREKDLLQKLIEKNIIDSADILELKENMRIEEVKKLHTYSICKTGDGRFKTNVKTEGGRKSIYGKTEKELWLKLSEWYNGETKTFEDLFFEMCKYRLDMEKVEEKTTLEYENTFNRFFKGTTYIKKPIQNITFSDTVRFLDEAHTRTIVKEVKKKRISKQNQRDIKTIINKTYSYANQILGMEIPCPMNLVDFSDYKVDEKKSKEFYSEEERLKLLDYLATIPDKEKDAYDWGIELNFELGLRIGELKAIRHLDIIDDFVFLHGQVLEKRINRHTIHTYVDYIKTQNEEGIRYLPLSDRAKSIIAQLEKYQFDTEFLFKKNGLFLTTCTFNRHLERHCKGAGIPYRSSHKIRFGHATRLVSNGCPLDKLSAILGHTNVQTTARYVRVVQKAQENAGMLNYM